MDTDDKLHALEVRVTTLEVQLTNMHDDIKTLNSLTDEVRKLRVEMSRGKGVGTGILLVLGTAVTIFLAYFKK